MWILNKKNLDKKDINILYKTKNFFRIDIIYYGHIKKISVYIIIKLNYIKII